MILKTAPVISNQMVMPGAHLIWLESPRIAAAGLPGQFVMVCCGEDTLLRRPLSIHQVKGDKIALLFRVVGKGTAWLACQQDGESLDLLGPLGNGFSIPAEPSRLLLIAGGMGIAPLGFLAQEAAHRRMTATLLLGAPTASQLYPEDPLPPMSRIINSTEDGTAGQKGMVTDLIAEYAGQADRIFACGPLPMYKTMAQMPELKSKPVQISLEIMMGCGRGVCYGCTVGTKRGPKQVCRDGPVFDLHDIPGDELAGI